MKKIINKKYSRFLLPLILILFFLVAFISINFTPDLRARITGLFIQQPSEIINTAPTITSVTEKPYPQNMGSDVQFEVDWNDVDADKIKIHICKSDAITGQTCDAGSWCDSLSFTLEYPASCNYTTRAADVGTNNYYAFTCDDYACSSSISGTFTVIPTLKLVYDKTIDKWSSKHGGFLSSITPGIKYTYTNAAIAAALFTLYERTGNEEYKNKAMEIIDFILDNFYDEAYGGFYHSINEENELMDTRKIAWFQTEVIFALSLGYNVTGNETYLEYINETVNFILKNLQAPDEGFYSMTDRSGKIKGKRNSVADSNIAKALFFAYMLTENPEYKNIADKAFAHLLNNYWNETQFDGNAITQLDCIMASLLAYKIEDESEYKGVAIQGMGSLIKQIDDGLWLYEYPMTWGLVVSKYGYEWTKDPIFKTSSLKFMLLIEEEILPNIMEIPDSLGPEALAYLMWELII